MTDDKDTAQRMRNWAHTQVTATHCDALPDHSLTYAHYSHSLGSERMDINPEPLKVDGSIFILLVSGKITVRANSDIFEVEGPAVIGFPHSTIMRVRCDNPATLDMHMITTTATFLQEVKISFSAISGNGLIGGKKSPVLPITPSECEHLLGFLNIARTILADKYNLQITRHSLAALCASLFYQHILLMYKRIDRTANAEAVSGTRRSVYVQDFIKLVHRHFTEERTVAFYARKLCLTPKYLSHIVKEHTHHTAAQWIDHFVIMEAKNLLRFSGKNIQQVAYTLNFPNQSSFGKYFKHLTGLSPSDFQKS